MSHSLTDNNDHHLNDDASEVTLIKEEEKKLEPSSSSTNTTKPKTGLVYLSRIPPSMSPTQLKLLLHQYAKVKRVFLIKENKKVTQRRKKQDRKAHARYIEGWVEFERLKDAMYVANLLNGHIIGGKKLNKFHDDLWNIKYLPGFQWHHLTEQIAYEKKQKELRLRNELIQAKKESKAYLEQVASSKMIQAIQRRAEKKKNKSTTTSITSSEFSSDPSSSSSSIPTSSSVMASSSSSSSCSSSIEALKARFKQHQVEPKKEEHVNTSSLTSNGAVLFSKLFGNAVSAPKKPS